jgi:hypothetical protein
MDDIAAHLKSLLPNRPPAKKPATSGDIIRKRATAERAAAAGDPDAERRLQRVEEDTAEYAERISIRGNAELQAAELVARHPAARRTSDPVLAAAIQRKTAERLAAADITAGKVMHAIGRIAFADIRRAFDDQGGMVPINQLDDDTAMAISSVDVETKVERTQAQGMRSVTSVKKLRMSDRMSALTLLAKHFKLVGDEGDGVNAIASALADRLDQAQKRMHGTAPAQPIEDAVIREPRAVDYSSQQPQPE